jgi:predicted DCC family thiol-disulfide oxidoreductase YuxK
MGMVAPGPVLLFDGECGLCVRCVRVLLATDRGGRLRFAPLQGRAAQEFLRERGLSTMDFDSAIFVSDWARRLEAPPLFQTGALFAAMRTTGGVWRLVAWLRFIPRKWRDALYLQVARRRVSGSGDVAALYEAFDPERFLL